MRRRAENRSSCEEFVGALILSVSGLEVATIVPANKSLSEGKIPVRMILSSL
jgi:hypothetical protein